MATDLAVRLKLWHSSLPSDLCIRRLGNKYSYPPLPHIVMLHLMYNLVSIVLHRPFIPDATSVREAYMERQRAEPGEPNTGGVESQGKPGISSWSARVCQSAAAQIVSLLELYATHYDLRNIYPMTAIQ
jgi:hypothetical protein